MEEMLHRVPNGGRLPGERFVLDPSAICFAVPSFTVLTSSLSDCDLFCSLQMLGCSQRLAGHRDRQRVYTILKCGIALTPPLSIRLREGVFVCVLGHRGRVLGESKTAGETELACTCFLSAFMTKILLFVDRTSHGTLEGKALFGDGFVEDALVEFLAQRD